MYLSPCTGQGHFGALVSKWPVTRTCLVVVVEQNGHKLVKVRDTSNACICDVIHPVVFHVIWVHLVQLYQNGLQLAHNIGHV